MLLPLLPRTRYERRRPLASSCRYVTVGPRSAAYRSGYLAGARPQGALAAFAIVAVVNTPRAAAQVTMARRFIGFPSSPWIDPSVGREHPETSAARLRLEALVILSAGVVNGGDTRGPGHPGRTRLVSSLERESWRDGRLCDQTVWARPGWDINPRDDPYPSRG